MGAKKRPSPKKSQVKTKSDFEEVRNRILKALEDKKKDQNALFSLAKEFFREYLKVKYAFTFEDAAEKVQKRSIDAVTKRRGIEFLNALADMEYRQTIQPKQVAVLEEDFRAIMFALSHAEAAHKRPTAKQHIAHKVKESTGRFFKLAGIFRSMEPDTDEGRTLRAEIDGAYLKLVDGDTKAAEGLYLSALAIYRRLLNEERHRFYPKLHALRTSITKSVSLQKHMEILVKEVERNAHNRNPAGVRRIYKQALSLYHDLPEHVKDSYYSKLMDLRARIA
ncbi:MAG: hypothetical protein ABIC95_00390 [archaeon]